MTFWVGTKDHSSEQFQATIPSTPPSFNTYHEDSKPELTYLSLANFVDLLEFSERSFPSHHPVLSAPRPPSVVLGHRAGPRIQPLSPTLSMSENAIH
ncbi:hypothetical protein WG66_010688 [Moniliophthora roreri]|nr:hypothetical protein WG66_010688 [Moniliophthora roreri]